MNRTLKETLTKLTLETGSGWVDLLSFTLLRARCTHYLNRVTPFEMFGRTPAPALFSATKGCPSRNDWSVCTPVTAGITVCIKRKKCRDPDCPHWYGDGGGTTSFPTQSLGLDMTLSSGELGASLDGTFYCYPDHTTAVKVECIRAWIHACHIKRAKDEDDPKRWKPQPKIPFTVD